MTKALEVGDLVFFNGGNLFREYEEVCKSPGVILNIIERNIGDGSMFSYEVCWANQKITIEHGCYIKEIEG